MTFSPIFCASIAQASPVGPAPMTSTSQRMSGRGLTLLLVEVSSSSAARKSGMGTGAESGRGDEDSSTTRKRMILARANYREAVTRGQRAGWNGADRPRFSEVTIRGRFGLNRYTAAHRY